MKARYGQELAPVAAPTGRRTKMRLFSLVNASFALLLTSGSFVLSDEIPNFDLQPICRGIAEMASDPGERGGPDLKFNQCIKSEQTIRENLAQQWSTFARSDREECVQDTMGGGLPSYSDLLTCLQMAEDAKKFNTPDNLSISK
jgi:hypothetical protein